MDKLDLIDIYRAFHTKTDFTFLSVHMEHSPAQITSGVTDQALINFKKLKSFHISSDHNNIRLDITTGEKTIKKKTHKHMKAKQCVSE